LTYNPAQIQDVLYSYCSENWRLERSYIWVVLYLGKYGRKLCIYFHLKQLCIYFQIIQT